MSFRVARFALGADRSTDVRSAPRSVWDRLSVMVRRGTCAMADRADVGDVMPLAGERIRV